MKKLRTLMLSFLALLSLGTLSLTSCSSFLKSDVVMIDDIIASYDSEGNLVLTITFTDDAEEPIQVKVPQGKTGNGIANITHTPSDNNSTIITITYTDSSISPTTFEVLNGSYIVSITENIDPISGNNTIEVTLSNGETFSFVVPRGEPGKDGVSITDITSEVLEDKSTIITITLSEGDPVTVTIPSPLDGKDGRGIDYITMTTSTEGDEYILTIYYDQGDSQSFSFDKPNTWHSGNTSPLNSLGIDGDFYYWTSQYRIYQKIAGEWVLVADLGSTPELESYVVSFDLVSEEAVMNGNMAYEIPYGHYFYSEGYDLPIPYLANYNFLGWYTSKDDKPTSGIFTDTTPVYRNMTLYARWEEII